MMCINSIVGHAQYYRHSTCAPYRSECNLQNRVFSITQHYVFISISSSFKFGIVKQQTGSYHKNYSQIKVLNLVHTLKKAI